MVLYIKDCANQYLNDNLIIFKRWSEGLPVCAGLWQDYGHIYKFRINIFVVIQCIDGSIV